MPAKPKIIIAQLEASGTAGVASKLTVRNFPFASTRSSVTRLVSSAVPKKGIARALVPEPMVGLDVENWTPPRKCSKPGAV